MWDKIPVTCPINNGNGNGNDDCDCTWSGTMGNYLAHAKSCCGTKTSQIQALQEQVSNLTTENAHLQDKKEQFVELVQELETKRQLQGCRIEELQNKVMTLNVKNENLTVRGSYRGLNDGSEGYKIVGSDSASPRLARTGKRECKSSEDSIC
jgi:uncharacterized protein YoxC